MQRLGVGIHENIVVEKAEKNDKGTLEIHFKQIGDINPIDLLNAAGSGSTSFEAKTERITVWRPTLREGQDTYKTASDKIAELKDTLQSILAQYLTIDKIKWDVFAGTGITADTYKIKVMDYIDTIYDNIVNQFVKQVTPFVGENSNKFRLLLVRQSAAKHYPKLRSKYLDTNPFIESMSVPASASKLKYTKFEVEKGLNNGTPVDAPAAASTADAKQAESLFA
jgi:hypothetical protein